MSKRIAIIGGGLAGAACAYFLKQAGLEPVIYEAGKTLADKASGNDLGLYNPRFTAEYSPQGQYYAAAFKLALAVFPTLFDIDWQACGALHLINDEKKERRFNKMLQSWAWPQEEMRIVNAQEAMEIAGVPIDKACLYLPQAGYVCPRKLCNALAEDVETHYDHPVETVASLREESVILAAGQGITQFAQASDLPLKAVRGQITKIKATPQSAHIQCNIQYGGYLSPPHVEGWHIVGSTFQRWLNHTDIMAEDDQYNIETLIEHVPALAEEQWEVLDARAALRTTVPDHFPIVGALADNLYVTTAHGSHGIISALAAARHITESITKQKHSLHKATIECLSPHRYDRGN